MPAQKRPRAVMVGVQLPGVSEGEHASSLDELARLGKTLGLEIVGRVSQRRRALATGAVLGDGKLHELAAWTGGTGDVPSGVPAWRRRKEGKRAESDAAGAADATHGGGAAGGGAAGARGGTGEADRRALEDEAGEDAERETGEDAEREAGEDAEREAGAATGERAEDEDDGAAGDGAAGDGAAEPRAGVVLVDHELTPSQARNLERATGAEVLDRTAVILSIFHRHAKSREARLQVELARLGYMTPRLREASAGADRQRGGIGGKGAGESGLELDRRKVRDRMAELRRELESLQRDAGVRRKRRSEHATVALVGYTNAGKSSLMRALTGSEIYVADELFATLDTTVRSLSPETRPRILVSDTVGFIKKLPHGLVASFKSTLDEAANADLQLHLVDAADPAFRAQIEVTRSVLAEIGADDAPRVLVLNKADRLDEETRHALAVELPEALIVSAHDPDDVARVHAFLQRYFERDMVEEVLFVPYTAQRLVAELHATCRVVAEHHDEVGTHIRVVAPPSVLGRIRAGL